MTGISSMRAYVGIITKAGAHRTVASELKRIGLSNTYVLFGDFDVICISPRFDKVEEFQEKWHTQIRKVGEKEYLVRGTETFLVIRETSREITEPPFAFVFLQLLPPAFEQAQENLLKIEGIMTVETVYGRYDAICTIKAKKHSELDAIITRIHNEVVGVLGSRTMIVSS